MMKLTVTGRGAAPLRCIHTRGFHGTRSNFVEVTHGDLSTNCKLTSKNQRSKNEIE